MFGRRTLQQRAAGKSDTAAFAPSLPSVTSLPVRDGSETRRAAQIDLFAGIGDATDRNLALGKILRKAFELVDAMAAVSLDFDATAETTRLRAAQFVASALSLKNQNDVIEERLTSAGDVVERAHVRSRAALAGVEDLTAAVGDIERAVSMIASIAAQTNLLALNATIEAARAGAAGAGFGVVAGEVKALSTETERATREITASVRRIRERAQLGSGEVQQFDALIGGLQDVFAAMRGAVEVQGAQTREISTGAEEVAALARTVRANAAKLQEIGGTVRDMTGAAERAAAEARKAFAHLTDRAAIVLSHADIDGRFGLLRWPVTLAARISLRDDTYTVRVIELSLQAIQIEVGAEFPGWALGETVMVEVDDIGPLSLRLLSPTTAGFEALVMAVSQDVAARIELLMGQLRIAYQPYIDRAQAVALDAQCRLERAIETGRMTVSDLFDKNYRRVGSAEPAQYTNRAVPGISACLGDRLDRELAVSPKPDFCLLQDRNGFAVLHNLVYSQPRRSDDERWNQRHSRMHRIFDDRVGMAASRNLQPFMVQSYARDMGDAVETRMEFDAPVFIAGRHWGAIRMAYQLADRGAGWARTSAAKA